MGEEGDGEWGVVGRGLKVNWKSDIEKGQNGHVLTFAMR